jgi:two-component system sensor histidine kinase BaeS
MRLRPPGISARLFLAILATAVLCVTLVGGVTRLAFERGFLGYLNDLATERLNVVQPRLGRAYQAHGNWDFLRDDHRAWFHLVRPQPGEELPMGATLEAGQPPRSDLTGATLRLSLLDAQLQWVAGYRYVTTDGSMPKRAIMVNGRTVGWLVLAPFQSVADGGDQRFQQGQRQAALLASGVALVLATLIAWWVARRLLGPVKQVAAATHALASGDHEVRVQIERHDEVGQLARDFNHLAVTLSRNQASRREFMADVSHELRTPLAVLQGELEALADGVRPMTPAAVGSLLDEVKQISSLVDDLYELALSDVGAMHYRMAPLDLIALLDRMVEAHGPRMAEKGLSLRWQAPQASLRITGDEGRLRQMLDNLLENARRYTDAPGQVVLSLRRDRSRWILDVDDSAPGVPDEDQTRLFERFFRVDRARTRSAGGTGLGLAICRNIVLAHDGEVEAAASELGGVRVRIILPAPPISPQAHAS